MPSETVTLRCPERSKQDYPAAQGHFAKRGDAQPHHTICSRDLCLWFVQRCQWFRLLSVEYWGKL